MRLTGLVVSVLLLGSVAGCGSDAQRDEQGVVTAADDVAVDRLRVGDCVETPPDGIVEDLTALPCSQPHDGEVYHSFELPEGDFPGDEQVMTAGEEGCVERYEAFVGTTFDESMLELLPLTPIEQGWADGDRGVLCIVQDPAGGLTASLKGAGR